MVKHIVLWNFKDEAGGRTKAENMALVRERLEALIPVIPEIIHLSVGEDLLQSPASYDMGLVVDFADMDAMRRYSDHPEHVKVSQFITAVRNERAVVDFEVAEQSQQDDMPAENP